jgi:hypothetical protein
MELDPERQAFVDAVMKPLGDDEARRELLENAVALAETLPAAVSSDRIRSATDRMESTARRFPLRHRIGLAAVTAVVLGGPWLTVAGPAARKSLAAIWTANLTTAVTSTGCCTRSEVPTLPGIPEDARDLRFIRHIEKRVPSSDLALLAGDFMQESPSARWKPVWDSHPRDPRHYYAYALAFKNEHKRWPERFVETGEELDPGNGWFRLMRGASRMEAAIGVPPPPRITRAEKLAARAHGLPPPRPQVMMRTFRVVTDARVFQEGWDDLTAALAMPRLEDYRIRLNRIRTRACAAPADFPDLCSFPMLSLGQPEFSMSDWVDLARYGEAFRFAADQQAKAGSKENLLELGRLHSRMVRALSHHTSGLMPALVTRNFAREGGQALSSNWFQLKDSKTAKRYENFHKILEPKLHPFPEPPLDALSGNRGSSLVSSTTGFLSERSPDSPTVNEPELRGGRLAEYAMYERLMMHAVALLLTLALAFLLVVPGRSRKELGLVPARLAGLLDRRDHACIGLLGVVLPAAVYLLSTRLPWLEPREFGLSGTRFFLWLVQAVALVVAIVLGTLQATRRRLGRRGAVLALGWVGFDPGRLFLPVALALIPIASFISKATEAWSATEAYATLGVVASMLGFPLLWLAVLMFGSFQHVAERTLHRATLMIAARPFVATAMMATVFAISWIHREEKHWTSRAEYDAVKSGHTVFVPRTEFEYGQWIAKETLRRLDEME